MLTEENFKAMSDGGMTAVELCLIRNPLELDFKKVHALANEHGIYIWSAHLPFKHEWPLIQKTPEERKRAYDNNALLIERMSEIGVDKAVIHPSWITPDYIDRREALDIVKDALNRLADFAHTRGVQLAVENLPPVCLGNTCDEIVYLTNENPKLRVCFDVNHICFDTHEDFIDKLRDKIITLHISDFDFVDDRHWFPGEGKIDWIALYKKLCEAGYDGAWIYELSPGTVNEHRSRPLTVRDFYNNAMEIFAGKQPSRI